MNEILFPLLVLGVLGAVFGLMLAIASKVFAVEVDERQEQIMECLPGANCGGCGFAGCGAFAGAVVAGQAEPDGCAPGGPDCAAQIGKIMGLDVGATERAVALVRCSGYTGKVTKKFEYSGIDDCLAAMRLGGGQGPNECPEGCIGMGSCIKACGFDAIYLENGIAQIDPEKCVGCMKCLKTCPKNVIVKVPYSADITVACNSVAKGGALRKYCEIGCLGCKMCEKVCETDAITVKDNLAYIDYSKCTSCGKCVAKCPRKLIRDSRLNTEGEEELTVPVVHKEG